MSNALDGLEPCSYLIYLWARSYYAIYFDFDSYTCKSLWFYYCAECFYSFDFHK